MVGNLAAVTIEKEALSTLLKSNYDDDYETPVDGSVARLLVSRSLSTIRDL